MNHKWMRWRIKESEEERKGSHIDMRGRHQTHCNTRIKLTSIGKESNKRDPIIKD